MACTVNVACGERLTDYHFGPGDGPWPLAVADQRAEQPAVAH
jgi:hypothetical protein